MEMPSSTPQAQTDAKPIEPVIPCREEDKISRSLITQQGDLKLSSNIIDNLVLVLFEMVKDGESPKNISDQKISDIVADSISRWGYTVPFDLAIRNLIQTSVDIRISIFKVGLPKAIKSGTMYHVKQLLLLVPNIDDLDGQDTEFVNAAITAAADQDPFVLLFKWLTNGRRPIEDFGLSVCKLLILVRSNDAVDILFKFIANRKQTLSEYGVSIFTVSEGRDETYKIKKLIEHGCDPNQQNTDGKTLLHLEVRPSNSLQTLLGLGFRMDIVDNDGNTSIHLAVYVSYPCLAKLLRSNFCTPAIVNIRNREGLTAYHLALKFVQAVHVRKWFLDAGADPKMEMPKGQFRDEVVAMLRKKDWVGEGYVLDDELTRELQA